MILLSLSSLLPIPLFPGYIQSFLKTGIGAELEIKRRDWDLNPDIQLETG